MKPGILLKRDEGPKSGGQGVPRMEENNSQRHTVLQNTMKNARGPCQAEPAPEATH
jgi:hypothetical protein